MLKYENKKGVVVYSDEVSIRLNNIKNHIYIYLNIMNKKIHPLLLLSSIHYERNLHTNAYKIAYEQFRTTPFIANYGVLYKYCCRYVRIILGNNILSLENCDSIK